MEEFVVIADEVATNEESARGKVKLLETLIESIEGVLNVKIKEEMWHVVAYVIGKSSLARCFYSNFM